MHPRTEELLAYLDHGRADLRLALDEVPTARQTTRPTSERWSDAEALEHLRLVERSMSLMFTKRLDEARARGLEPEREVSSIRSMLDITAFLDRTHARKAPELNLYLWALFIGAHEARHTV